MAKPKGELDLKSSLLKNKKIIVGVTGSISAVESIKLIHELRRHGSEVYPVMSDSSKEIIHPSVLEYASGNRVVEKLTGAIEHVRLVEDSDLLLVAPSTANTISKMSLGIDDTPVTSVFTNALEKIPIVVVPAMHRNMYSNPIITKNIKTLKSYGVRVLEPILEESKAKIADYETIVAEVIRSLHHELRGRKICVIGGSSYESIDDVRVITNKSTGETAVDIAQMAYYMGADVDLFFGSLKVDVPSFLKYDSFGSIESLISKIDEIAKNDVVIVPAALSDFTTEKRRGKISTEKPFSIKMEPAPKFLKILRSRYKGKIVGFKAEYGVSTKELVSRARRRMNQYSLDMMVANDLRDVRPGATKVLVVKGGEEIALEGEKTEVARRIIELLP